jgi:hypothetical protein
VSVQGLCQICESAVAEHQCQRCGALVCPIHYDEETGLCTGCSAETSEPDEAS